MRERMILFNAATGQDDKRMGGNGGVTHGAVHKAIEGKRMNEAVAWRRTARVDRAEGKDTTTTR